MTRSGRAGSTVATANPAIVQPQSDGELDIEEHYGDGGGKYEKERRTKKKADATNWYYLKMTTMTMMMMMMFVHKRKIRRSTEIEVSHCLIG